ncbi:ninjurin-1-like [Pipistrellus kuhlii]|uniref:ninjurin-1-like n=1 Tax=Pipistrellus kuhlii TaxID=59472 RepID=UPI00174F4B1F|nr:ninjurin-1-like [Pipistrellus kuhlii]
MDSDPNEYELNGNLQLDSLDAPPDAMPRRPLNMNNYANKKSVAEGMLDVALLMANASQLNTVITEGPDLRFYVTFVVLISISLVLEITLVVLLIFLVKTNLNNPAKHAQLIFFNNMATGLVFIIVVVNIFITAFGI